MIKITRSDALNKILSESVDDYRKLTSKDLFLSLGHEKFTAYFEQVCTESLTYYFNFTKFIPEISITKNAVEYSTLLSQEEDIGVLDFDVLVSFAVNSGDVTVKVIAQYDVEYVPPRGSKIIQNSYNVDGSAQRLVIIPASARNLKASIDDAFDEISSDKKILAIESDFNHYISGEED